MFSSNRKKSAPNVNPIMSNVTGSISRTNTSISRSNATSSRVNASTSRVNASTSRVNASTSRVNASSSRVNASTSRVSTSASGVTASTSRLNANSDRKNPSTTWPNPTTIWPNPTTSRVNPSTSKVKATTSRVHFYEPSSHVIDAPRKASQDYRELPVRKNDPTKKNTLSRCQPISCISGSPSQVLPCRTYDIKTDSRFKDIRPSTRRPIGDYSISDNSSLGVKGVRKCFVRHSESEIPRNVIVQRIHSPEPVSRRVESVVLTEPISNPTTSSGKVYKSRYATPELYSSLTVAKAMKECKIDESKPLKSIPLSTLKRINKKASAQLNFSPEDKLFKDLVNLDISDQVVKKPLRRVVRPKLKLDKVPPLSDYYVPEFLGEYSVQNKATLRPIGKLNYWDGLIVNQRCLAWEEFLYDSDNVEDDESDE